jgi:hypothetical protein
MVKAILSGKKTQTRRIVRDKYLNTYHDHEACANGVIIEWRFRDCFSEIMDNSPHYSTGDVLWVRERFSPVFNGKGEQIGIVYGADCVAPDGGLVDEPRRWKPSIHMPRTAARIFLTVTNVRCERLQAISESDAGAEGFESIEDFHATWNKLNAKRGYGWDTNPLVFAYDFQLREGKDGKQL